MITRWKDQLARRIVRWLLPYITVGLQETFTITTNGKDPHTLAIAIRDELIRMACRNNSTGF